MNSKIISCIIENNIVIAEKLPSLSNDKRLNEILLDNLKNNPDIIGLIDAQSGETCTYKKLTNDSIRCALWLKKQGIGPGDVVAICSDHKIAVWVPLCSTFFIGANLNIWYDQWSPESSRYFAKLTKPKIVFANEQSGIMLQKIFQEENIDTKLIIFGKIPGIDSLDDVINGKDLANSEIDDFQCYPVKDDDDALLIFSSGTSGLPKGVQHSYRGVLYNSYKFYSAFLQKEKLISSISTPLYWIGTSMQIMRSLLLRYPTVILDEPTPEEFCQAVKKYKVQWIVLGTSFLNKLFKSGLLDKFDFSFVEEIIAGGAKVRSEILKKVDSILPNGIILQAYGLTEFGGVAMLQIRGHYNYESSGRLTHDVEMKIIDTNVKKILGPNEEGEICLRQTYIMKHYFSNSEATKEAIQDGWLHTGDLGFYDKEKNIFIVDRIKEMIKYKGHHISPNEIEHILVQHPEVLDAAVVGVPHLEDIEHTLAFVVAKQSSEAMKEELFKMASVLGERKRLHKIVFVENLPRKSANKIDRSELKTMGKAYAE